MSDEDERARRRTDALAKARALDNSVAQESRQAAALLAEFVEQARQRGLEPTPLTARSYDGAVRYRTSVMGWYLKNDRSVGVSTTGEFYVLSTPRSWRSRLRGAAMEPSPARLVLGRGARDGESIDLKDALAKLLDRAP